jgi:hypothetical protein
MPPFGLWRKKVIEKEIILANRDCLESSFKTYTNWKNCKINPKPQPKTLSDPDSEKKLENYEG